MSTVAAVVLAAGRSTRYRAAGGTAATKLVATFRGEPLVRHAAVVALGAGLHPVLVVTGHADAAVGVALAGLPVRLVHNAGYASGLASSLAAGLAVVPLEQAAAVVMLGDMPLVRPETIAALLEASRDDPDLQAVVPVVDTRRGNPVLLRRSLFATAVQLHGDEGARRLLRSASVRVGEVAVDDPAVLHDIDDPAGFTTGLVAVAASGGETAPQAS